jgi:hypothetical protein
MTPFGGFVRLSMHGKNNRLWVAKTVSEAASVRPSDLLTPFGESFELTNGWGRANVEFRENLESGGV